MHQLLSLVGWVQISRLFLSASHAGAQKALYGQRTIALRALSQFQLNAINMGCGHVLWSWAMWAVTQIKAWFYGLPSTFVAGFYLVWQISSIWSWAVIQLIWSNRQAPTGHIHNPNQRHIQCCFDHQFFSVKSLFYELEKDVLVSI